MSARDDPSQKSGFSTNHHYHTRSSILSQKHRGASHNKRMKLTKSTPGHDRSATFAAYPQRYLVT